MEAVLTPAVMEAVSLGGAEVVSLGGAEVGSLGGAEVVSLGGTVVALTEKMTLVLNLGRRELRAGHA